MNYNLKFFDFSVTDFIAIAKVQWSYDKEKAVRKRAGKQACRTRKEKLKNNVNTKTIQ